MVATGPVDVDIVEVRPPWDGVGEAAVHRPVNPTILTPVEFAESSAFLDSVRSGPTVA